MPAQCDCDIPIRARKCTRARLHSLHVLIEGKRPREPRPEAMRLKELEESNWRLEESVEELEDEVRVLEEELRSARTKIKENERADGTRL